MPAYASGNDGRVRKYGQSPNTGIAGLNKWSLSKQTAKIVIPHFESPVDSDGNVWPTLLRGLSSATGTASGFIDVDPATAHDSSIGLSNGLLVELDLVLIRSTSWGLPQLPVFIDQIDIGTDINNQAATFSMNFTVNGVCRKTGF